MDPKNQKLLKGVENLAYKMTSCSSCTAPYAIRVIKLRHILVSNVARICKPDMGMKFLQASWKNFVTWESCLQIVGQYKVAL
jgi:hypothetical protein